MMDISELLDFDETNHLAILLKELKQEDAFLVISILCRAEHSVGYAEGVASVVKREPQ